MRTLLDRAAPAAAAPPRVQPVGAPAPGAGVDTPPLWLPGGHFAAALAFWAAGALGVVAVAPDLARGAFPLPRVAAVTHLFTLGWITASIQGALYQFLPVALGTPIRSRRLAAATGAVYVLGLTIFLVGLTLGAHALLLAGAAAFGTALLAFAGNLAATLRRAPERGLTWWCLAGAAASLVATVALGASLAGNLRWGYLGADRFLAVGVHLHVAAAGWVLLVMIGVAHRLLPMFLLSHGASQLPGRLAAGLTGAGVAGLLAFHHAPWPWVFWLVGAVLAAGAAAFLAQAALYFRHRRRPALDAGMRLAGAGLGMLGLAVLLSVGVLVHGVELPRVATAYGVALVGALSLFVAGFHYKIVPFLVWFHRFGPLAGRRALPRVADLYAARPALAAAALLPAGALGLVAATLAGSAAGARLAAAVFAAGALVLAAQVVGVFRRRPE